MKLWQWQYTPAALDPLTGGYMADVFAGWEVYRGAVWFMGDGSWIPATEAQLLELRLAGKITPLEKP